VRRRKVLVLAAGAAALRPLAGRAQQVAKVPRIGYLTGNLATGRHLQAAFLSGLPLCSRSRKTLARRSSSVGRSMSRWLIVFLVLSDDPRLARRERPLQHL
jgi:hypothetical protein